MTDLDDFRRMVHEPAMQRLEARIRELEYDRAEMRKAYNALEREKFDLETEVEELEERASVLATMLANAEAGR